ncbi:hypothetical protein [Lacrimispora saccharolytica]|uniref:hypothetical protein n=1 Tax=Lacrimispora saccharolytica TaxID=84030 RepID=UPI000312B5BC|nr:hypothetical protein [Lacrimispora saccharolytica]QRV20905.1 hypothetical protein I6K70_05200 [Lacrimispora saccharolytica]
MNDGMERTESVLEQIPGFQYLYKGEVNDDTVKHLIKKDWALEAEDREAVRLASLAGMGKNDIYFTALNKDPAAIKAVIGTCRFVVSSLKELELINEAAAGSLAPGHLEVIGIAVIPEAYDKGILPGFRVEELNRLSAEARKLRFISIRGCFIQGNTKRLSGESLGRYLRDCYETAKLVTTTIPCGMSYINAGNFMEPATQIMESDQEAMEKLRTAAKIMVNQNQTAFYAKLLLQ